MPEGGQSKRPPSTARHPTRDKMASSWAWRKKEQGKHASFLLMYNLHTQVVRFSRFSSVSFDNHYTCVIITMQARLQPFPSPKKLPRPLAQSDHHSLPGISDFCHQQWVLSGLGLHVHGIAPYAFFCVWLLRTAFWKLIPVLHASVVLFLMLPTVLHCMNRPQMSLLTFALPFKSFSWKWCVSLLLMFHHWEWVLWPI